MSKINTISVITASYNAEAFIEGSIKSIIEQNYEGLEYIIIDGGSKDTTVDIIKKYQNHINYWVSEPDKGIYDAWNKGVEKATGDWIMFIGCDDRLLPGTLQKYSDFIDNVHDKDYDYISSKKQIVDTNLKEVSIKGGPWEWPAFQQRMTVAHPGSLHSQGLFAKYGRYNFEKYKKVGDYEFLLRAKDSLKSAFLDDVTVVVIEGGASESVDAIKEHFKASTITGNNSVVKASFNFVYIFLVFKVKKLLALFGLNYQFFKLKKSKV